MARKKKKKDNGDGVKIELKKHLEIMKLNLNKTKIMNGFYLANNI